MNDKCKLEWCNSPAYGFHPFCKYHWVKLSAGFQGQRAKITALRPAKINGYLRTKAFTDAVQDAADWLKAEHETLVDCPKCKGRGVNLGHTAYLRGKHCTWCNNGKKAKIY